MIDQATPANSTITAADTISGGTGTDVLNVAGVGTTLDVLGGALVSGIETVNIRATTANTLDASQIAGLTAVNANLGVGTVGVTNLASGASIGVIGNGTVVNGAVSFAYATASSDVTLNLSGGTKVGTTVTNSAAASAVTKATINSTGAANTIGALDLDGVTVTNQITSLVVNAATNLTATLTADDFATTAALTVSGAASSVDLGAAAQFKTIDATGLTAGGLTVGLATITTSFKGGAGSDKVTTAATTATTAGMVDGGAGTDTLILAANMTTAAEATEYVNFETVRLAAGGNHAADILAGITAIELQSGANAVTMLNATQAAAVTALADITTGAFSLTTDTGTADVFSMVLGTGLTTSEATDTGALTLNGFETINLKANGGATSLTAADKVSTIASFTADKATAINLTGQSFDLTNAAVAKAVTISGSALTGTLTLAGSLIAGSTVTGSAQADSLTLGTVGSTYNAGAGDDAISSTVANLRTGAVYNTIDGGAGTDTLTISNAAAFTMVDDDFKAISNVEKFVVTSTTTGAQSITTGGWFEAGFKAAGVDLTTTSTTGAIGITMSSFTGNATISATSADAGGAGVITIATGTGNDKVTVASNAATITNTVSTGAGNDTIIGGAGVETITGGAGADTMTGAGGADVFVFGATDSVAGTAMDAITDFNTGGADVIDLAGTAVLAAADATALVAGSNVQTSVGGLVTFATADNTLALKIAAIQADVQLDAAETVAIFVDGSNSYVYSAGAAIGNADDLIIQLTGVTGTAFDVITITASNNLTIA